jgi:hypothetical protein
VRIKKRRLIMMRKGKLTATWAEVVEAVQALEVYKRQRPIVRRMARQFYPMFKALQAQVGQSGLVIRPAAMRMRAVGGTVRGRRVAGRGRKPSSR